LLELEDELLLELELTEDELRLEEENSPLEELELKLTTLTPLLELKLELLKLNDEELLEEEL
jgi:hypothetical protein